jgi:hypothetical protein
LPDRTCETVLIETLAARATSRMVTLTWRGSSLWLTPSCSLSASPISDALE